MDKNTKSVVLRCGQIKNYDFIKEHNSLIMRNGYVWMGRAGKTMRQDYLKDMIKNKIGIFVLTSKDAGNRLYYARLDDYSFEKPSDNVYPEYYNKIFFDTDSFDTPEINMWLKITSFVNVQNNLDDLVLNLNNKTVKDVINSTRTGILYIHNIVPICFEED